MQPVRPADWIRLLRDNAKKLRAAGVTRIKFEGLEVDLAPPEPQMPAAVPVSDADISDALDDPATFGGSVPRFKRRWQDEDEQN